MKNADNLEERRVGEVHEMFRNRERKSGSGEFGELDKSAANRPG